MTVNLANMDGKCTSNRLFRVIYLKSEFDVLYTDEATNAKSGKTFVELKKMGQLNARKSIQQRSQGVHIHNQTYIKGK